MDHERTDEDSGSDHDQDEKHDLLKGVDDAEVDGAKAGKSHCAHTQE
jgi:hypothetical protein